MTPTIQHVAETGSTNADLLARLASASMWAGGAAGSVADAPDRRVAAAWGAGGTTGTRQFLWARPWSI